MKHSYEERLLAVKKCLKGYPPFAVGREMGINEHDVSEWLLRYQQEGIDGLQKRPMKRAGFTEKCKIVCEFAEKGVPLHRVSAEHHVSQYAVQSWTRIYRKGGYEALRAIKPVGQGCKGMGLSHTRHAASKRRCKITAFWAHTQVPKTRIF